MDRLNGIPPPDLHQGRWPLDARALTLAPASLRMVIAGKDLGTELDALAVAVEIVEPPGDGSRDRVYAMATELAQAVEAAGVAGLAEAMKAGLEPDAVARALRLGLAAVFSSPLGDDSDIGILAGIAERLGLSDADFSALFESAKAAVDLH